MADDYADDLNILALVKGSERYVFIYDGHHREETLRTLGRFADNNALSFNWYDVDVLSQQIRQEAEKKGDRGLYDLLEGEEDYNPDIEGLDGFLSEENFSD